jgi:hypothetical protein
MVDDAVLLMPPGLRMALERHRLEARRGALEPLASEGEAPHRPPWDGGVLDRAVARAASDLEQAVAELAPFPEIALRFGRLAHFIADAGFPPLAAGARASSRSSHFAAFCESRRERFPLVFYGYSDTDLERTDYAAFARRILETARSEDRELERAYREAGIPPDESAFDDRSVPFAVASLCYSRTVTDIARAWLAVWARAGGDLSGAPYGGFETRSRP